MKYTAWIARLLPILLAISLSACGGGSGPGTQPDPNPDPDPAPPWPPTVTPLPPWEEPGCDSVAGPPVATLSPDAGITVLPNDEELLIGPDSRTQSIAPLLHWGGRVFTARGMGVYRSTDGGCTWEHMYEAPEPLTLVPQTFPTLAFGVGDRGDTLYAFGNQVEIFDIPFHAIDIAPAMFSTLHALAADDQIMRLEFSMTDQDVWEFVGMAPAGEPRFLSINPRTSYVESAHMIVTMVNGPPMVTFDDGQSWTMSSGIQGDADTVRTGRAYFSHQLDRLSDEEVDIWIALERDRIESGSGDTVTERVIARSTDGGLTFSDVVEHDDDSVLLDERLIDDDLALVFPLNTPGEVLFTAGECPEHEPRLYHYRASEDSLTVIDWDEGTFHGIESVYFLPSQFTPGLIYFGHRAVDTCD